MEIGASEAAERLGISVRRVRQLLESGQMSGRKVGDNWVLDESQLRRKPAISRPLSERMAWGLIDLLSNRSYGFSDKLAPHERYRLREMANRLQYSDDPVPLLRAWLVRRAQRLELSCAAGDLSPLAQDARVIPSGISDQRSGMSAGSELELYVTRPDLDELITEYLLVSSARPNLFVHVSRRRLTQPTPLILLAADLADHNGARENSQAQKLLKVALWS